MDLQKTNEREPTVTNFLNDILERCVDIKSKSIVINETLENQPKIGSVWPQEDVGNNDIMSKLRKINVLLSDSQDNLSSSLKKIN